jgi:hypothetical protein
VGKRKSLPTDGRDEVEEEEEGNEEEVGAGALSAVRSRCSLRKSTFS